MNYTKPSKISLLFTTMLIISLLMPLTAFTQELKSTTITTRFLQTTKDIFNNSITINENTTAIIVLFASPLCKACTYIEQELDRIHRNYKNSQNHAIPLIITIVKSDSSLSKTQQKYNKLELDYPWILDDNEAIFNKYEVNNIPTLFIFNTQGDILKKFKPSKLKSLDLQTTINKYNKEK